MSADQTKNLNQILLKNKQVLLDAWFEAVAGTYPLQTSSFMASQKDQFANPVGATITRELDNIFQELLLDESSKELWQYLDALIRIRAVQGFYPSSAVSFVRNLKQIIRDRLHSEIESKGLHKELLIFEERVDQLTLMAFDVYMRCREKIWELKAKEAQNRTRNLLRKKADVEWTPEGSSE